MWGNLSGGLPSNDYFLETDWRTYNAKAQLGVVFDQTPQGRQERLRGLNLVLGRCAFEGLLIDGFKGFQTG